MKQTTKIIFAVLSVLLVLAFIIVLSLTGRVPKATDKALTEAFTTAEQRINLVQPGYTNQVLSPEAMKSFLSDSKALAAYLQIPYVVWLIFAAYLNFMVFKLN